MSLTVLFACVHNAGRSQMAAALFNARCDPSIATAMSAGTQPADHVHAEVVTAMRQRGFDLADRAPRLLTDELAAQVDVLVTMGCGEACPVVPGVRRIDWGLEDPKGQPAAVVERIRDEIEARIERLVAELTLGSAREEQPPTP